MSETADLLVPRGFRASGVKAGIKPSGGDDLAILLADGPSAAAGTFTTNRICAAPVKWCRELLPREDIRGVVINSGNANAATGDTGNGQCEADGRAGRPAVWLPRRAGPGRLHRHHRPPAPDGEARGRTGARGLRALAAIRSAFLAAARAIMTTDTRPKLVSERRSIAGKDVTLLGHCQGRSDDRPADGDHAGIPPDRRPAPGL